MNATPDPARVRAALRREVYSEARDDFFLFLVFALSVVQPGTKFIPANHLRALAYAVERLVSGDCRRLLVAIAPRFFKSFVFSVALPAYLLGRNPSLRIACASYGDALSSDFEFQFRKILDSTEYRRIFPATKLVRGTSAQGTIATTQGGYRLSTSVGGPLTGKGCDYLIIDDPLKADEAESELKRETTARWFRETAMTRLDDRTEARVVVVSQRLHQDDLVGRLISDGSFDLISLPAKASQLLHIPIGPEKIWTLKAGELLFPERVDESVLKELRADLSEAAFQAQIMQNPVPRAGTMIEMKYLEKRYNPDTMEASRNEAVFQSWDTAISDGPNADYSVCTTWAIRKELFILLDVYRAKLTYPELKKAVFEQKKKHNATAVIIEQAGTGLALLQELRGVDNVQWVQGLTPKHDKLTRLARQLVKIEAGRVALPRRAPWLGAFEEELRSFPLGRHDDQVDSMTQMLEAFDIGRNHPVFRDLSYWKAQPVQPNHIITGYVASPSR